MRQFTLEGKTVLVTGASSGIGRGVAVACAKAGATVILVGRNEDRLAQALDECGTGSHLIKKCDVSSVEEIKQLVDGINGLDGVVMCAGVSDNYIPLKFLGEELVDEVLGVNLKSPILLLGLLEKKKRLNRGASVVMMSSISSFAAVPAHSLYAASKGGLTAFVKAAAVELAVKKIRVNSIAPGMVNTPLIAAYNFTEVQKTVNQAKYPLKRYGEPEDIVGAAIYLLSDASSWMTGQQIVLDGGLTIKAG